MNIFAVHPDARISASMLCDSHCNKMVLESAQMLANCFSLEDLKDAPYTQKGEPRKHSYFNHPSSKWARQTKSNMRWLLEHAVELERQRRLRGYNPHFSTSFLSWCNANFSKAQVPSGELSEFSVAINEKQTCRSLPDFPNLSVVEKYRAYYIHDKPFATWKLGNPPKWYVEKKWNDKEYVFRQEYLCQFVP